MSIPIKFISSGLGAGYCPIAPGTIGSLWSVAIYLLLYPYPAALISSALLLFVAGFAVSRRAELLFGEKDSKRIVIDEIASMCLVSIFIKPDWFMLGSGFLFFRFFDIVKPPPARMLEGLSGARAVMLDDVVAAVYTILMLFVFNKLQAGGILPVMNMQGPAA
jgi:phosphatidylglycerophosphatase A